MHTSLLLQMAAEALPDRIALGSRERGVSFAELASRARAAAGWFEGQSGDTIVFLGLNGPEAAVAMFSAALCAKPFAPLNFRLPDEALRLPRRAHRALGGRCR